MSSQDEPETAANPPETPEEEDIFQPQKPQTVLKTDPSLSPNRIPKVEIPDEPEEPLIDESHSEANSAQSVENSNQYEKAQNIESEPNFDLQQQQQKEEVDWANVESEKDIEEEIRIRTKLDNIIGGTIPHLEAIMNITLPKDKYKVIYDKLFEQLLILNKKLAVVQIFCQKEIDWSQKDDGLVKYISDELNITPEEVRRGPNFFVIGWTLKIMEETIFNPAFRTWPKLATTGEKIALYKSKMSTWRKIEVMVPHIGSAACANKKQITFQKEGTGKWKKLNEIATFVTSCTQKEMNKKFDDLNNFIYLTTAAHGKTAKVLLNIRKMSKKELEFHMSHPFEEYEEQVIKATHEGYKQIWKKNNTPKLSSKLWKNVFSYMINQEQAMRDLDLFIAFCNKDCIKVSHF